MALMKPLQLKLSSPADAIATPACTVTATRPGQVKACCATQISSRSRDRVVVLVMNTLPVT